MFVFANFIMMVAKIIDFAATLYVYIVIARVVLSWIQHDPNNSIIKFIYDITEPVLVKIRQYVPSFSGFDIAPMVLILGLFLIENILISILTNIAMTFK